MENKTLTVIFLQGTFTPLVNAHAGRTQMCTAEFTHGFATPESADTGVMFVKEQRYLKNQGTRGLK